MATEQVHSLLFSKANVYAWSYMFTKLSLVNPLYMGNGFTTKEVEHGKGWGFIKINLVWRGYRFKGVSEGMVFDPSCMMDGLRPKRSGERFSLADLLGIHYH